MSVHSSIDSNSPPHTPDNGLPYPDFINPALNHIPYENGHIPIPNQIFTNFNHLPVMVERGINFRRLDQWGLIRIRGDGWSTFCHRPRSEINVTLVKEFYNVLSEANTVEALQNVTVRGVAVTFTSEIINNAYHIPPAQVTPTCHFEFQWGLDTAGGFLNRREEAYYIIFRYYNRDRDTSITALLPHLRVWKRFINNRVYPTTDFSVVSDDEILLLYAIASGAVIDWGILIQKAAIRYAFSTIPITEPIPFPWLISRLCTHFAGVPELFSDEFLPARIPQAGMFPMNVPGGSSDDD